MPAWPVIALPGLPLLPRLSFTRWLLIGAATLIAALLVWIYGFRVDLPVIGGVGPHGLIAERDEARAQVAAMLRERRAAIANSKRVAAANNTATEKANADEKAEMEIAGSAAERFIAAGGVRRCPTARADAPAPGEGAGLDAGAGALPVVDDVPVVTVLPEDVRICTENTVKARAWREWGLSIEANHAPAAEPVEP